MDDIWDDEGIGWDEDDDLSPIPSARLGRMRGA